jgi:hypothetical protein
MQWATFWAIFSQTHLVTLVMARFAAAFLSNTVTAIFARCSTDSKRIEMFQSQKGHFRKRALLLDRLLDIGKGCLF